MSKVVGILSTSLHVPLGLGLPGSARTAVRRLSYAKAPRYREVRPVGRCAGPTDEQPTVRWVRTRRSTRLSQAGSGSPRCSGSYGPVLQPLLEGMDGEKEHIPAASVQGDLAGQPMSQ